MAKNPHFPFPSSCCKQPSSTASPAWHQLGVLGVLRGAQLLPAVSPGMIWAPREAEGALAALQSPTDLGAGLLLLGGWHLVLGSHHQLGCLLPWEGNSAR